MQPTGRLFLCGRCRVQVLVCSHCDRGQIYCSQSCSLISRRSCVREAGQRYQASRRGRFSHAARSRRYRARQKNVTHQGSPLPGPNALLPADSTLSVIQAHQPDTPGLWQCHFCRSRCSEFVRAGFLRGRRVHEPVPHDRRGAPYGHSP
jgi:hypothetical protein